MAPLGITVSQTTPPTFAATMCLFDDGLKFFVAIFELVLVVLCLKVFCLYLNFDKSRETCSNIHWVRIKVWILRVYNNHPTPLLHLEVFLKHQLCIMFTIPLVVGESPEPVPGMHIYKYAILSKALANITRLNLNNYIFLIF